MPELTSALLKDSTPNKIKTNVYGRARKAAIVSGMDLAAANEFARSKYSEMAQLIAKF